MIAATQLIKSLHSYGIRLYCSLWNFVQFEEGKGKRIFAQMITINQIKINADYIFNKKFNKKAL